MSIVLGANSYGKSAVRLVKVTRGAERHELRDLTIDIALEGDFEAAHVAGDNAGLLTTDTMRNTVYALAKDDPIVSIEAFAQHLAGHFVDVGPQVTRATVHIVEHPWARLAPDGRPHPHAFQRGNGGNRLATVTGARGEARVESGIDDLLVLKTAGSGFGAFLREQYTTLPETSDRILATVVAARWNYRYEDVDYNAVWDGVRETILRTLGDHYSPSVQFTLHRMGEAVLEARPEIERIRLSLPNKHHLLFDLSRFGMENDNEIFHATNEPYGLIEGTVERAPEAAPAARADAVQERPDAS
jgi:urate oxidase